MASLWGRKMKKQILDAEERKIEGSSLFKIETFSSCDFQKSL
jgi:hypothetical protein